MGHVTTIALAQVANRGAESFAEKLIRAGKTVSSESWSGPSAGDENRYLDANGYEAYGKWFLGRNDDEDPETKAHYSFPMSSDFERIDRKGLVAIRSRSAQFDDMSIFEAAGRLLDLYAKDDETEARKPLRISFQRRCLKKRGRYLVNATKGVMSDVSLIQIGEAKGHGMWIDEESLSTALEVIGENLPAYVTHEGAVESDRILKEVGVFSSFYVDKGKLKAETFTALSSFREDEPERYRRLFDLAEAMPDAFGLSLVFEADLVWVNALGEDVALEDGTPEESLRDLPSVRFQSIRSADFVDAPAANEGGLFSSTAKNTKEEPTMSEEKTDSQEEIVLEEEVLDEVALEIEPADAEEVAEEVDAVAELAAQVAELTAKVDEQAARIEELTSALSDSQSTNEKLSALVKGEEALSEGDGELAPKASVIEQFQAATGADKHRLWKQNRDEILRNARRA